MHKIKNIVGIYLLIWLCGYLSETPLSAQGLPIGEEQPREDIFNLKARATGSPS